VDSEHVAEKVTSGGDVKAPPKVSGDKPEGVESAGGDRVVGRSNPPAYCNGSLSG